MDNSFKVNNKKIRKRRSGKDKKTSGINIDEDN